MKALRTILRFAVGLSFAACTANGAGDPTEEATAESAHELRTINPCASVLCAAGSRCEVHGGRAVCVPDPLRCTTDADCRLYDDYCNGCSCDALPTTSPDPKCTGTTVACFAAPCMGKTAICSRGMCVVSDASL